MTNSSNEIRNCVRAKVRAFCFAGAQITDDEIGKTKISDLPLSQNPNMPGVSPMQPLVIKLKKCVDISIDLSVDTLTSHSTWTVDDVSQYINGQTI
ncbi:MAG: hypothetical protein WCS69_04340 [Ignavibacteriaceae bacterium]|jgi:hypothetical protein